MKTQLLTIIAVLGLVWPAAGQGTRTEADYRRAAAAKYPALTKAGSPLNERFLNLIELKKAEEPAVFAAPNWPLTLADEAAWSLAGEGPQTPASTSAPAQAARGGTLVIDVHNVSASRKETTGFKDGYGGHDTSFQRERRIEISLRSMGGGVPVDVTTFWVGKKITSKARLILSKHSHQGVVDPALVWQEASGNVKGSDLDLPLIGYHTSGCSAIEGWVVRIVKNGSTAGTWRASDPYLIDWVKEHAK